MEKTDIQSGVVDVEMCMGSSCFSRGGNRALVLVQTYLKENGLEDRVHVRGHLCQGKCQDGPNLVIDGRAYDRVDPAVALDLLKHHLEKQKSNCK